MNKLFQWDLYKKSKLDMNCINVNTLNSAWITSGYVIAESVEEAKEKIGHSFDLKEGDCILSFDLGESHTEYMYVQDEKHADVFIQEYLLEKDDEIK